MLEPLKNPVNWDNFRKGVVLVLILSAAASLVLFGILYFFVLGGDRPGPDSDDRRSERGDSIRGRARGYSRFRPPYFGTMVPTYEAGTGHMKSPVVKHSIVIAGRKTSVSLEHEFWDALREIASDRYVRLSELVGDLDAHRQHSNLSSALRLFVLEYYRGKAAEKPGHEMFGQQ